MNKIPITKPIMNKTEIIITETRISMTIYFGVVVVVVFASAALVEVFGMPPNFSFSSSSSQNEFF